MLFGLSLLILTIVALISLILGAEFINAPVDIVSEGSVIINGSTTTYESTVDTFTFVIDVNPLIAGVGILLGLIAIASLFGLKVLGSGLSDQSVRVIIFVMAYGGIWSLLSVLAYQLIVAIDIFGYLIYIMLSIMYVVGCVQKYYGGT